MNLLKKTIQPVRIQMKRTRGFNLQQHSKSINGLECVVVSRPTKFGNPFMIDGDMIYVDAWHRRKILSRWVLYYQDGGHTVEEVVELFKNGFLTNRIGYDSEPEIKERFKIMKENVKALRGKNLACYCKIGDCCHADFLLKVANSIIIK